MCYAGPCLCQSTMCACLMLDRAEITAEVNSLNLFTHVFDVHVKAVFFLQREIYGYFSRMRVMQCVPGLHFSSEA